MKVLHLISGGDSGGAKTHVLTLLKDLNGSIQADLVCYMDEQFAEEARQLGIPTTVYAGSFLHGLSATRERIKTGGYDIVHCHGSRANLTGAILKTQFDIPFVSTVHSDYKLDYLGRPMAAATYGTLNKNSLRKMDYRICVSDNMRQTLTERGFDSNRMYTIYNGVDFSYKSSTVSRGEWLRSVGCDFSDDDIILGIAARLDPVKDVATTVRGFAAASAENERLRLLIAGDGMEREALETLVSELGISEKVFFAGWLTGMDGYYASVDINAISSLSETFPYAVTEAARAGIPTVASRVGGLPKIIISGETGMLFEPRDTQMMAQCILALANDEDFRRRLGDAVREKARREFSTESTCRRQLEIYESILKRQGLARQGAVICGAYGHGNAGDEAILTSIVNSLRTLDPDMPITVISKSAAHTRKAHGLNAVRRSNVFGIRRELRRAKLFISGGGSLLQDVTSRHSLWFYLFTIVLAKKCGCKVQMYGCGIGPLNILLDEKQAAKIVDKYVDAITLRDPISLEFFKKHNIKNPSIRVSGDPVLNLPRKSDMDAKLFLSKNGIDPDGNYICISLRPWDGFGDKKRTVSTALRLCREKYGLTPIFMPMNYEMDVSSCMQVAAESGVPYSILPRSDDVELDLALVHQMRAVVSMRLHSLLYAVSSGVPAVGISYDPKVFSCSQYLGFRSIDFDGLTVELLMQAIDEALADGSTEKVERRLEDVRRAERLNIETAQRLLKE